METSTKAAVVAGLAGAGTLNLIHETARRFIPNAPHVHEVAMQANQRFVFSPLGIQLSKRNLYLATLAGDLVSNSVFYAAVVNGMGRSDQNSVWKRATLFGLGAGVLTVILPPLAGLKQQPTRNFAKTATLTAAWYLLGSLVAAAGFNASRAFNDH